MWLYENIVNILTDNIDKTMMFGLQNDLKHILPSGENWKTFFFAWQSRILGFYTTILLDLK